MTKEEAIYERLKSYCVANWKFFFMPLGKERNKEAKRITKEIMSWKKEFGFDDKEWRSFVVYVALLFRGKLQKK